MNNLDSVALSKMPYDIRPKSGGYSHTTQFYNILDRNLKDILCFRKKKVLANYLKKSKLQKPLYYQVKINTSYNFRSCLKSKKASLSVQMTANTHVVTHTVMSSNLYLSRRAALRKGNTILQAFGLKKNTKLRRVYYYQSVILSNCTNNFLNYIGNTKKFLHKKLYF